MRKLNPNPALLESRLAIVPVVGVHVASMQA
jgi:hypothetical protein